MAKQLTAEQAKIQEFSKTLESMKGQIARALPKFMNPERMTRIALTEFRTTPNLRACDVKSVLGAIVQSAQLGLEPGGHLGHAYLVPYKTTCQLIIGYRGMIDLARRSGQLVNISAHEVYENDVFEFEYGLEEKLRHIPARENRGEFIAAYAVARLKDGGHQIEVMFKSDIDQIRGKSKSGGSSYSPWSTAYEEMAKKTVIRRLFKYLPVSIEIQRAVTLDESAERGEQMNEIILDDDSVIEGEANEVKEPEKKNPVDELNEILNDDTSG